MLPRHPQLASSKFDYSVDEHLYMLPSDMNLKIRSGTVGYNNNKILVSDRKFSLGKNDEVNSLETPAIKSHETNSLGLTHTPAISQNNQEPKTITNNEEKIALVLTLAGGFAI